MLVRDRVLALADTIRARAGSFRYSNEERLQLELAAAFAAAGLDLEREVRLSRADRIDFLWRPFPFAIGVEVKMLGQRTELERQLERYAASDQISGLVLVTPKLRLGMRWPAFIGGKPFSVVYIGQL